MSMARKMKRQAQSKHHKGFARQLYQSALSTASGRFFKEVGMGKTDVIKYARG